MRFDLAVLGKNMGCTITRVQAIKKPACKKTTIYRGQHSICTISSNFSKFYYSFQLKFLHTRVCFLLGRLNNKRVSASTTGGNALHGNTTKI